MNNIVRLYIVTVGKEFYKFSFHGELTIDGMGGKEIDHNTFTALNLNYSKFYQKIYEEYMFENTSMFGRLYCRI